MKRCFKCGKVKDFELFYKHKQMSDGYLNKCKECTKLDVKKSTKDYDKTEKGVIRVIYKTQKSNSKKRLHCQVEYTKDELSKWMYLNNFKALFDQWVESGFLKSKKPSVDRVNDFDGYNFSNIRLVTWAENAAHQHKDIMLGLGTSGKRCRAVNKMDDNMDVICSYVSYQSARRDVGYKVEYQIKNKVKCRNGFYWGYA